MQSKRFQTYFFIGLSALALVLMYLLFRPYLGLMCLAAVLAVLAWPVYAFLLRFFRGRAVFAALLTVFLTLVLILLPLVFATASLVTEVIDLFNRIRDQVQFSDIEATLGRVFSPDVAHQIAAQIGDAVGNLANDVRPVFAALTSNIISLFSNTVAFIFGAVLTLLGMYYMLKDGPALKRLLLDLSPLDSEDDSTIIDRIRDAIRGVAIGSFATAAIKGVIGGILFFALGLEAPVFWGTMIALSNFLPGIGTAAVTIPFAIFLFVTGHFWKGLILSIVSGVVIGLVDNIITPVIIKSRIHAHPMLILLSIFGGLSAFGAAGIFFGPMILGVAMALTDMYRNKFAKTLKG